MTHYPEVTGAEGHFLDPGPMAEMAVAAEAAGWSGFSLTEHPAPSARWLASGGHQSLDPFVALGYVAAVTSRMKLLTYLSVLPYRNPLLLAKSAATVDVLSNGRFILGVGAGYLKGEFYALGIDFDERNALFDEALEVLPMHWSGEPFSYTGRHFTAREVMARPRPVQDPIPIWIGGNSALTRRRVAERADGWMPLLGSAELFATTRTPSLGGLSDLAPVIAELRSAAGQRGDSLDVVVSYTEPTVIDPTHVERHRQVFGELADAGVTWVVAGPGTRSGQELLDFLAEFGALYLTP